MDVWNTIPVAPIATSLAYLMAAPQQSVSPETESESEPVYFH